MTSPDCTPSSPANAALIEDSSPGDEASTLRLPPLSVMVIARSPTGSDGTAVTLPLGLRLGVMLPLRVALLLRVDVGVMLGVAELLSERDRVPLGVCEPEGVWLGVTLALGLLEGVFDGEPLLLAEPLADTLPLAVALGEPEDDGVPLREPVLLLE